MTSIPVRTWSISRNNLKRGHLKNQSLFLLFLSFLKCALNLEHFEKKEGYSSLVISKDIDSEKGGYLNV